VVSYHCPTALHPEEEPSATTEQDEGCASDRVWTFRGRKNLVPTEIRTTTRRLSIPIPNVLTLKSRIITGERHLSYAGLLSLTQ